MGARIALVTGATGGLGRVFVDQLLEEDGLDELWAVARTAQKLERLRDELGSRVVPLPVDLANASGLRTVARMLEEDVPEDDVTAVDPALLEHLARGGFFQRVVAEPRVLSAYLHVTQRCNLACAGCYSLDEHRNRLADAPLADMKRAVEGLAAAGLSQLIISGGEPFCKAEPLYRLAVELKKKGKHLMAYSGYTFEELMQLPDPYVKKLLGELDLLVDGRFIMEQKNIDLRFRGSANQRVLDVPKSLEANAPVWAEQYR